MAFVLGVSWLLGRLDGSWETGTSWWQQWNESCFPDCGILERKWLDETDLRRMLREEA